MKDAEMSIIAACICYPGGIYIARSYLSPNTFSDKECKYAFAACLKLAENYEPIFPERLIRLGIQPDFLTRCLSVSPPMIDHLHHLCFGMACRASQVWLLNQLDGLGGEWTGIADALKAEFAENEFSFFEVLETAAAQLMEAGAAELSEKLLSLVAKLKEKRKFLRQTSGLRLLALAAKQYLNTYEDETEKQNVSRAFCRIAGISTADSTSIRPDSKASEGF